jgi:hypothetical protein
MFMFVCSWFLLLEVPIALQPRFRGSPVSSQLATVPSSTQNQHIEIFNLLVARPIFESECWWYILIFTFDHAAANFASSPAMRWCSSTCISTRQCGNKKNAAS